MMIKMHLHMNKVCKTYKKTCEKMTYAAFRKPKHIHETSVPLWNHIIIMCSFRFYMYDIFFRCFFFLEKKLPTSLSEVVDLFHWSLVLTETLIYGTFWSGHGLWIDVSGFSKWSQGFPTPLPPPLPLPLPLPLGPWLNFCLAPKQFC